VSVGARIGRLPGLDAVRSGLVLGVVVFHATHVFDPFDFYVKSDVEVEPLAPLILFASLWGMPLFFVLAGIGVWHSLSSRSVRQFTRERATRLMLPFLAGVVLIVPPQIHMDALDGGEHVSYADTLSRFFDVHWRTDFPLPLGGPTFETAHLWFLAFLFGFTLLLLPVFLRLRGPGGARILDAVVARPGRCVVSMVVIVALAEMAFGTEDTGGWNRWGYPAFLLAGFVLAARPEVGGWLAVRRRAFGIAGAFAFIPLAASAAPLFDRLDDELMLGHDPAAVLWRGGKAVAGTLLVLAIVGMLAQRWKRSTHRGTGRPRLASYASEAALPVYILHQTVTVVLAYYVVRWPVPVFVQWLALTMLTLSCSLGLYEVLRRWRPARAALGMRAQRAAAPRLVQDDRRVVPGDHRVRAELLDSRPLT
jgi:surface polysaccharide O-acyltransferase-like enzyme